ncbi:MAG: TMF family protein, partial [Fulvivirga sp.]
MTVKPSGNVLIGKTSQSNTSYKLDVSGKVRANEIIVNTDGADYVFEEGYKLKSLREVEAFINENNHLPGIPSAAEMQEQGMSVGELNTRLLEKIEELMLYNIQQNKKINRLEKNIEELKNEIKKSKNLKR